MGKKILTQIEQRKNRKMVLFVMPFVIKGHRITEDQKKKILEKVMEIFKDRGKFVYLVYNRREYMPGGPGYNYKSIPPGPIHFDIEKCSYFAIRFNGCHYNELDKQSGQINLTFVSNLYK